MQVLGEKQRSQRVAARAEAPLFTGKCDQHRVIALLAAGTGAAVGQNPTREIPVERLQDFPTERPVPLLEQIFPLLLQGVPMVVDQPVEDSLFWSSADVTPELTLF